MLSYTSKTTNIANIQMDFGTCFGREPPIATVVRSKTGYIACEIDITLSDLSDLIT